MVDAAGQLGRILRPMRLGDVDTGRASWPMPAARMGAPSSAEHATGGPAERAAMIGLYAVALLAILAALYIDGRLYPGAHELAPSRSSDR